MYYENHLFSLRTCVVSTFTLLVALVAGGEFAGAQTLTVLHAFAGGTDGDTPYASLVRDTGGNLYGTTQNGGTAGLGTVFEVSASGKEKILHSFTGNPDGQFPYAPLVRDSAGNLYGTTFGGGALGQGTVFKIDKTGAESILHSFGGPPDGEQPWCGLLLDAAGNLYGTTGAGGTFGYGSVFKLDTAGALSILHSFDGTDGQFPAYASLIQDSSGNLYGPTYVGGSPQLGTIFELDNADLTVLHTFTGGQDGEYPVSSLVRDHAGNLYGTSTGAQGLDSGTVFKFTAAGKKRVLYRFTGGTDGSYPNGALIRDSAGNLYGTTIESGTRGAGTVYKVDTSGAETVLYTFSGGVDGAYPYAGLIRDASGTFYGTTTGGGHGGFGVVFKLTVP